MRDTPDNVVAFIATKNARGSNIPNTNPDMDSERGLIRETLWEIIIDSMRYEFVHDKNGLSTECVKIIDPLSAVAAIQELNKMAGNYAPQNHQSTSDKSPLEEGPES